MPTVEEFEIINEIISDKMSTPDVFNFACFGSSESSKIKLMLFNIYDGYLSSEYGSNSLEILSELLKNVNDSELLFICPRRIFYDISKYQSKKSIDMLIIMEWVDDYFKYYQMLCNLNLFKLYYKYCICVFGTTSHQTILYFNKLSNHRIQCTYINTGEGQINTYDEFFDILESNIEIKNFDDFILRIKPFLFYKTVNIKTNDKFNFFMGETNKDYNDDFLQSVINTTEQNKNYYARVANMFNKKNNDSLLLTKYNNLSRKWADKIREYERSLHDKRIKYKYMAFNTFHINTIRRERVLINMQLSGTCVLKSFMIAIFHHILLKKNEDEVINFYEKNCDDCVKIINDIFIKRFMEFQENENSHKIVYKMINDGLLNESYDFYRQINTSLMLEYTSIDTSSPIKTMHILKPMETSLLNNLIDGIRTKKIKNFDIIIRHCGIENIYNRITKDMYIDMYYSNFVVLWLLFKYYNEPFNHESNDISSLLYTYQIKLTYHEINYINDQISFSNESTFNKPIEKYFERTEKLPFDFVKRTFIDTNFLDICADNKLNNFSAQTYELFLEHITNNVLTNKLYNPEYIRVFIYLLNDAYVCKLSIELLKQYSDKYYNNVTADIDNKEFSQIYQLMNIINPNFYVVGLNSYILQLNNEVTSVTCVSEEFINKKKLCGILKNIFDTSFDNNFAIAKIREINYDVLVSNASTIIDNPLCIYHNFCEIKYNDEIFTPCKPIMNHILIKILSGSDNNFFYLNKLRNKLLCVLKKTQFKCYTEYCSQDQILEFRFGRSNELYFNGDKVIISNDINEYPFLIFAPRHCINLISETNNKYKLIIINILPPLDSDGFRDNIFFGSVKPNTSISYFLTLNIKENYVTPFLDNNIYEYLQQIYLSFDTYYKKFVSNYDVLSDHWIAKLNEKISHNKYQLGFYRTTIYGAISDINESLNRNFVMINNEVINNKDMDYERGMDLRLYDPLIDKDTYPTIDVKIFDKDRKKISVDDAIRKYKKQIQQFIIKHPICTINCLSTRIIKKIFDIIKSIIPSVITLKRDICQSINFVKKESFIDLIYTNYPIFCDLLQINSYLTNLYRLQEIFENCKEKSCYEFMEINQLTHVYDSTPITYLEGITEIIFGNIVKQEQWDKYRLMINNFNDTDPRIKWEIHHIMMGKGKSSIITPLLCNHICSNNLQPIIIVPEHLVNQTESTMFEFKHFIRFNKILKIMSDYDAKLDFLHRKLDDINNVFIIDEFDSLYNPIQSNFNKITENKPLDNVTELMGKIWTTIDSFYDGTLTDLLSNTVECEVKQVLTNTYYVSDVTYGMSKKHQNKKNNVLKCMQNEDDKQDKIKIDRLCIPYQRENSPCEGSLFKSNIITITLTILYFHEKKYRLESLDLDLIYQKYELLFMKLCAYYRIINTRDLQLLKNNYNDDKHDSIEWRKLMFQEYVYNLVSDTYESIEIKNCSFIDLIGINNRWQVGYTGTVNIKIPDYPFIKYSQPISDYDESLGVYFAITGTYPNSKNNNCHRINGIDDVFYYMKKYKYNVLIDGCAYLKKMGSVNVATRLYYLDQSRRVIYLLPDDTKMIIENGLHRPYKNEKIEMTDLIYYSQRHTVGIDFKQPNIFHGLILLDKKNNYTQVAQGIYRLRKLNRGHTISLGCCDDIGGYDKQKIYDHLVLNDLEFKEDTEQLLNFQIIKYYVRFFHTSDYAETDLLPLHLRDHSNIRTLTLDTIKNNVFKDFNYEADETLMPIYDSFIRDINKVINVVFGSNEHVSVKEEVREKEHIQEATKIISVDTVLDRRPWLMFLLFQPRYYCVGLDFTNDTYVSYFKYDAGDRNIIFSWNLCHIFEHKYEQKYFSLIIIKLNDNTYLLDYLLDSYYVNKKPMYNLRGEILNLYVLKKKYPSQIFEPKIDIEQIFNVTLTCVHDGDYNEINIGSLISPYYKLNISFYELTTRHMNVDIVLFSQFIGLCDHLIKSRILQSNDVVKEIVKKRELLKDAFYKTMTRDKSMKEQMKEGIKRGLIIDVKQKKLLDESYCEKITPILSKDFEDSIDYTFTVSNKQINYLYRYCYQYNGDSFHIKNHYCVIR